MRFWSLLPLFTIGLLSLGRIVHDNTASVHEQKIQSILTEQLSKLRQSSDVLKTSATLPLNVQRIDRSYQELRRSYKSLEMFIEYIDPTFVAQMLNGAPLPKLDAKSQFVDILEPHGLQVLDELVADCAKGEELDTAELITEIDYVATRMNECCDIIQHSIWTDRMILEACRTGVIRVMAMGLSGFDRPGSGPGMNEYAGWAALSLDVLRMFENDLSTQQQREYYNHARELYRSLRDSVCPLPDSSIDKLELIRTHLDPLYSALGRIHIELGIELSTELGPAQPVLNPRGMSMFSETLFNPYATTGIHYSSVRPELVDLGKLLFFDPILSANGERSCASCHDPSKAFTDGRKTSVAYDQQGYIRRNAPTLINSVFARRFFYDLRAQRVSDIISHVITDSMEFNSTMLDVVGRIRSSPEYISLFEQVFQSKGPSSVTNANINLAIGGFLSSLVSFNSRIDRYARGENVAISESERRGMNIFMGKGLCATCHFPPTFAGYVPPAFIESESEIIGVPMHKATSNAVADPDQGRAGGILREHSVIYQGSFKTPTVRNVSFTAPYFHNGAYSTLDDVVEFYKLGGGNGIGLNLPYQTLPFDKLDLSDQDAADLVAFLQALSDQVSVKPPARLPAVEIAPYRSRTVGGSY